MTDLNTLSAKELVRHHNAIPGCTTIPGLWKASKASLLERIRIAQAAADVAKSKAEAKVDAKNAETKTRSSDIVKLAAERGCNPKILRARLRKAGFHAPYDLAKVTEFLASKKA